MNTTTTSHNHNNQAAHEHITSSKQLYEDHHQEEESLLPQPVSPISQGLSNSTMTFTILTIFEFETPITESETLDFLRNDFVPMSPRFSWTIETDKKGVARWRKVEIRYEDHLIVPTFPSGLQTREEYDVQLREYLSEIGGERFPEGKPLWEAHLIKYPSLNGVRSLVLKSSHAIGDGCSYIKVFLYAFKRAGNPSLPLSLPQVAWKKQNGNGGVKKFMEFISKGVYSASDVGWSVLKTMVMKDRPSAIRSETTSIGLLFRPININTMTFSLERLYQHKSKLGVIGATINDLIMSAISYMIHLYMVRMADHHHHPDESGAFTILIMVNMRQKKGYNTIHEMVNAPDSWGNHSRLMPIPIPSFSDSKK